jgi:hypothetical protein
MMQSGLPSLLEAIFEKKDLASVSLDEIYEVVREFPSFNAGHFLLSKKLKQENDASYEKETMRTALYFNNPFWLQSVLDEDNILKQDVMPASFYKKNDGDISLDETSAGETVTVITELFEKEITWVPVQPGGVNEEEENVPGPVSSFDELISKYQVETEEKVQDRDAVLPAEPAWESGNGFTVEAIFESPGRLMEEPVQETMAHTGFQPVETVAVPIPDAGPETYEIREEIVNEYGIFEEVVVKKADEDLEAFDRTVEVAAGSSDLMTEEIPPVETPPADNDSIVENQAPRESAEIPLEQDYESFDRPSENAAEEGKLSEPGPPFEIPAEPEPPVEVPAEHQTSRKPFDAKHAESIVFAPYHMVDYFASQGIRLVLEDMPADHLGKQLKSFTDWLKVMKKLPARTLSGNTEERDVDRIRHFAAHSIEERDILTESMAEVLAKQGMYENAIALYQKLSLIYPPKSAYFASRIEQLKASLP